MAYEDYHYITAGLAVAKNSGQSPASLHSTHFITAGLPPVVEAAAPSGGLSIPVAMHHYIKNIKGG